MLNVSNNQSTAFGAKFNYSGFRVGYTPQDNDDKVSSVDLYEIQKNQSPLLSEMSSFLKFIKTPEGKQILNKLPDQDVVVLTASVNHYPYPRQSKLTPIMQFVHNGNTIFAVRGCNLGKDEFETYVDKAAEKINEDKTMQSLQEPFNLY